MPSEIKIEFNELIRVIKKLPKSKLIKLQTEINNDLKTFTKPKTLTSILLDGPTFSQKQLNQISKNRKAINRWRAK